MDPKGLVMVGHARPVFGDRLYFMAATIFIAVVAIGAFTPSFYLRGQFPITAPFPVPTPFIAFHGVLMTGWIVLLFVQSLLVSARRTHWHRTLGYAGFAYAAVMVPVGCMATLVAAEREVHAHSAIVPFQLNVLGLELTQMALFGVFVAAAAFLRARSDQHKRLVLLATLCILPNAIVRLSFMPWIDFLNSNFAILIAWASLVLGIVAIDVFRTRRLHPVYLWGAPFAILAIYLALVGSRSAAWDHFWLASLT